MESLIKVGGMSCQGCVRNVTGVLSELEGVRKVEVSLERGEALVTHADSVAPTQLMQVIRDAGFDAD